MNKNKVAEKLKEIIGRGLCSGTGKDPEGQICVEQAIALAMGEPMSDAPTCVAPAVRSHSIALNDCSYWSSPKVRGDSMLAYALTQLGCKGIDEIEFVKRLALENIRQILPIALRATASLEFFKGKHADALEAAAKQCEQATNLDTAYTAARTAAYTAAYTAYTAAYTTADTAYTAADTAYTAADTAYTAADTTANTARTAADTAYTAADTAYTAADTALKLACDIACKILEDLKKEADL